MALLTHFRTITPRINSLLQAGTDRRGSQLHRMQTRHVEVKVECFSRNGPCAFTSGSATRNFDRRVLRQIGKKPQR